jgi:hypothetical protein
MVKRLEADADVLTVHNRTLRSAGGKLEEKPSAFTALQ